MANEHQRARAQVRAAELLRQRMPVRRIEAVLAREGLSLSKSAIADHAKRLEAEGELGAMRGRGRGRRRGRSGAVAADAPKAAPRPAPAPSPALGGGEGASSGPAWEASAPAWYREPDGSDITCERVVAAMLETPVLHARAGARGGLVAAVIEGDLDDLVEPGCVLDMLSRPEELARAALWAADRGDARAKRRAAIELLEAAADFLRSKAPKDWPPC